LYPSIYCWVTVNFTQAIITTVRRAANPFFRTPIGNAKFLKIDLLLNFSSRDECMPANRRGGPPSNGGCRPWPDSRAYGIVDSETLNIAMFNSDEARYFKGGMHRIGY